MRSIYPLYLEVGSCLDAGTSRIKGLYEGSNQLLTAASTPQKITLQAQPCAKGVLPLGKHLFTGRHRT